MELYQIKNGLNKAFSKAVCSNSPLGRGNKKQQAIKAYDDFMATLQKIYNS